MIVNVKSMFKATNEAVSSETSVLDLVSVVDTPTVSFDEKKSFKLLPLSKASK